MLKSLAAYSVDSIYSTPTTPTYVYESNASVAEGTAIQMLIAAILALIGGVLLYFLFVKKKEDPKNKFAKWLKDFLSFKIMWLEPVLKIVYYIATIFIILFSFSFLSAGGLGVLAFFACLILGPILIRLAYEMTMMFIMIWRNTQNISENTKKK